MIQQLPPLQYAQRVLMDFQDSRVYRYLRRLLVFSNIWWVLCLGTADGNSRGVRTVLQVYVALHMADVALKVFAQGPIAYLFKSSVTDAYHLMEKRWDLAVVFLTAVVLIVVRSSNRYEPDGSDDPSYYGDIAFAIPCLRLVTCAKANKKILFGLSEVIQHVLYPLATLLLLGIYTFAVTGVLAFSGYFRYMPEEVNSSPETNFDSVTEAISTLFQIMVGENWHEIMFAAMDTPYGYTASIYFLAYVILVSVLFANMFIGILSQAYQDLVEERMKHDANEEKLLQDAQHRKNHSIITQRLKRNIGGGGKTHKDSVEKLKAENLRCVLWWFLIASTRHGRIHNTWEEKRRRHVVFLRHRLKERLTELKPAQVERTSM
eukprot:scaffold8312_cov325-Pinguiococcus_pyrenoidosus.AAC.1